MAAPSLALAQNKRWRMVTSWPKRLPGPGMSAERVAERIKSMSGGRLDITVHAAGEVVTGLLYLEDDAQDLHAHLNTVATPLNKLTEADLCPGSQALDTLNASYR